MRIVKEGLMLRRKAYDSMLEWKRESGGSTALLVEGARRVGKSTLVEEFGRREYRSCLVVDFFQAPAEVRQYFEDNRNDFDTLFLHSMERRAHASFGRKSAVHPLGCFALLSRYPRSRSRVTSSPRDSANCET